MSVLSFALASTASLFPAVMKAQWTELSGGSFAAEAAICFLEARRTSSLWLNFLKNHDKNEACSALTKSSQASGESRQAPSLMEATKAAKECGIASASKVRPEVQPIEIPRPPCNQGVPTLLVAAQGLLLCVPHVHRQPKLFSSWVPRHTFLRRLVRLGGTSKKV